MFSIKALCAVILEYPDKTFLVRHDLPDFIGPDSKGFVKELDVVVRQLGDSY